MDRNDHMRTSGLPISHEGFIAHKGYRYLKLAGVVVIAAIAIYLFADVKLRPNGGTWYGYTLGTISALLIVWLMMLGIRKRAMTPGNWSLKGWTSAHVYLGSSLLVLATLHTGFQFGLNVHTLAYVIMVIVILSGFIGVYYYSAVPRKMSDNRAHRSQKDMLDAIRALNNELREAARPLDQKYLKDVTNAIRKTKVKPGLFISIDRAQRQCATTRAANRLRKAISKAEPDMRRPLEAVTAILERKAALLLRTRRHIRSKTLLQLWLYIHVPLSFALLAALTAHIISVFFYW
ncbi:hypothetical protein [Hyphococcus sp.]|uniref:hypothetical protein n=1 Tax=Hyphococcus sp. TaxID=2038636 RepID=UPI00207DB991|nr:MAG: hypothetical protein DHS20C04_15020 [Marinicaulis sp.]